MPNPGSLCSPPLGQVTGSCGTGNIGNELQRKEKRNQVYFFVEIGFKLLFLFMTYGVYLLSKIYFPSPAAPRHTHAHTHAVP